MTGAPATARRVTPTAVRVLPADADRDEWLTARRTGIGASEIAAVLGISPYDSPFSLYWRKREGWDSEESPEMRAGHYAEPVIADWFADQDDHPDYLIQPAGLYAHPDRPWQRATPDRLLIPVPEEQCRYDFWGGECTCPGYEPVALLECKYVIGSWDGWGEPGTDDVPVHYRAQCLWQLDVLGVDEVYLAAWHGAEFRTYLIRRDERDLRTMRAAGAAFWARLQAGDPPDVDGHQATIGALKQLHPSIEDRDVEVPVEFAEGYRRARALTRRAQAAVDRYEARARQTLGGGRRLVCNGHLVCSRSIYDQSGDTAELLALDGQDATVDRLNPGRAASYITPKGHA